MFYTIFKNAISQEFLEIFVDFIFKKNRLDITVIYIPSISYLKIKRKFGAKYAASKKKKNGHDPEK